jgi:hypothetical protein
MDEGQISISTLVVASIDLLITTVGIGLVVFLLCLVNPSTFKHRLSQLKPRRKPPRHLEKIPSSDTDVSLRIGECSSRPQQHKHKHKPSGESVTESTDRRESDGDQMSEREHRTMYNSLSNIKIERLPTTSGDSPIGLSLSIGTEVCAVELDQIPTDVSLDDDTH